MIEAIGSCGMSNTAAAGAANRPNPMQGVAELLGLSPSELMEKQRGGSTLAQVAEQQGVSRADLIQQVSHDLSIRFGADAPARAEQIVDRTGPPPGRPRSGTGVEGVDFAARASEMFAPVANALQMSTETLLEKLEQGTSLTDVANEQGTSLSSLLDAAQQGLLLNAWA